MRVIVAVALPGTTAPAQRAHGLLVVRQLPLRVAAVLPPTDRVRPRSGGTSKPGVGGWDQNACCKARVTNSSGMVARALPAADLLTDQVLKGAPVGPLAVGQRQTRDIADSHPVRLGRLGLVEESVRGAFGSGGSAARARSRSCTGGRLWAARAVGPAVASPRVGAADPPGAPFAAALPGGGACSNSVYGPRRP